MELVSVRGGPALEPVYGGVWPAPPPPAPVLVVPPPPPPALVPVPVARPVVQAEVYEDYPYESPAVVSECRTRFYQKPTVTELSDDQVRQLTCEWQRSGNGYKSYVVGSDKSLTVVDSDDVIVVPSAQKQCKWRVVRQQAQPALPEVQTTKISKIYPAESTGYLARPSASYVVPAAPAAAVVYPARAGRLPVGGFYYPPAPVPAKPELVYEPAGYYL